MGNAGNRKVTVVLQFVAINFSTPLTPTTPTALSPTCRYRWGWGGPCLPHETNYLSIPSGWFPHKSETNVRGIAFGIPYWATFWKQVGFLLWRTNERNDHWSTCGFKRRAVSDSVIASNQPSRAAAGTWNQRADRFVSVVCDTNCDTCSLKTNWLGAKIWLKYSKTRWWTLFSAAPSSHLNTWYVSTLCATD